MTVSLSPDRSVHLESPHAVVVVGRSVVIPTFAAVESEELLQTVLHAPVVNLVAFLLEETDNEHVEEHPVAADSRSVAIAEHCSSELILLLLSERIPKHVLGS